MESVRLCAFSRQPPDTLEVLGVGRERILLLVVPPSTDPDIAHEAMMTAGRACYRPACRRRVRRFRARSIRRRLPVGGPEK
ncbi:DUF5994 family protein [Mycobacterium sp.]|uniref:DUF5994 family protein n=1 Tax=Mycobacterium sp. TaxID=1785 RepID=UPI00262FEB47|nr:DUF5994 family protein [Mycobacterium sp.]